MLQFDEYKVKFNNLRPQLDELEKALNLDSTAQEVDFWKLRVLPTAFGTTRKKSQRVLQKLKQLKSKLESQAKRRSSWEDMMVLCEMGNEEDDESLLPELEEEYNALVQSMESARLQTLLTGEYDASNAILAFHAWRWRHRGPGLGPDALPHVYPVGRAPRVHLQSHGLSRGGRGFGIKSATIMIEGENAYGFLHGEHGVHRLVRVSPFDANARRQTSFASVEVMPDLPDDVEVEIRPEDIEMQVYRASGAGGQHVNKTSSAVRLIHIPTGVVVSCQTERSQFQNRDNCMKMLRAKLVELQMQEKAEKISDLKGVQLKIEWGSQIRSYVFMPYTLVKDTRTGYETSNVNGVMDGDLDGFINAYLTAVATGNWARNKGRPCRHTPIPLHPFRCRGIFREFPQTS